MYYDLHDSVKCVHVSTVLSSFFLYTLLLFNLRALNKINTCSFVYRQEKDVIELRFAFYEKYIYVLSVILNGCLQVAKHPVVQNKSRSNRQNTQKHLSIVAHCDVGKSFYYKWNILVYLK